MYFINVEIQLAEYMVIQHLKLNRKYLIKNVISLVVVLFYTKCINYSYKFSLTRKDLFDHESNTYDEKMMLHLINQSDLD